MYSWLVVKQPLKNDGLKVSWDDEIPNMMGKITAMFQGFQTTDQKTCQVDVNKISTEDYIKTMITKNKSMSWVHIGRIKL
jgi:aspartate/tyrosine/aromatic aminotransferase